MLDWNKCPAVERITGKVSGAWLFKGTRVPVTTLFENLEDGATVGNFLEWFPGVTREQIEAVLEHSKSRLLNTPALSKRALLRAYGVQKNELMMEIAATSASRRHRPQFEE
jgi:uncharacterized protein (DUF433 family)